MTVLEATTAVSFKNILFPTDFTEASDVAFRYAAAFAQHHGAWLYPAHAIVPFLPNEMEAAAMPDILAQIKMEKCGQLTEMGHAAGVNFSPLVTTNTIEEAVPFWTEQHGIDLIVMGTHGRKGVERMLLGSSAETIFRTATCPVLTVGPNVMPPVDELKIRKILFATALTRQSGCAATYALSFAREGDAALTVLHVMPPEQETRTDRRLLAEFALNKMKELVSPDAGLTIQPEFLVEEGNAASHILECAHRMHPDLIILGLSNSIPSTHFGRGVAYRVASGAPAAVLTVRGLS